MTVLYRCQSARLGCTSGYHILYVLNDRHATSVMHVKSHRAPRTLLIQFAEVCSTHNLKFCLSKIILCPQKEEKAKKVMYKDTFFHMDCTL